MSGECILVIDDSREIVKHLTESILPTFGYQTLHAFDGQSGLKLIREKNPDLVMLDFNLPEMTGIDVLQQLARESISTPVIVMSGYGSEQSAIDAFRLGAKDYLIKPFTMDEIVTAIDQALVETRLLHDKEELAEQLRRVKVEMSRQAQEMKTLFSIGKAITSLLSVDKVLERVLAAGTELTGAEESTIWMPDDSGEHLHAYEKHGHHDEVPLTQLSITDSQVGQVLRTGRPIRQSVFSGKGLKVKTGYFARAVLYVPLKLRGEIMGVLSVSNRTALRSFSRRDEFLLLFLADYAAIALENAKVYQTADRALSARLEELSTLIEITRTITASLDLNKVVEMTMQLVHESWQIEASSLWLLNESNSTLRVLTNVGTPYHLLSDVAVPIGKGIVGHVAESGEAIYTNNAATHPLHYRAVDRATGFLTRSVLCVPLKFRGQVVGALELVNKEGDDFDERDVERAQAITTAVAIAVTNALLFEQAERRKKHLEATLEHNDSPILITNAANELHLLNRQARDLLGLSKEAVGRPVAEVLNSPELVRILTQPEVDGEVAQESIVLADGSTWMTRVGIIPNYGRILMLQDAAGDRNLPRIADHRLPAMSSDIQARLSSIHGLARELSEAGPLTEDQHHLVDRLVLASRNMMDMAGGLRALDGIKARPGAEYEECNVLDIVTEVVNEYQGQALSKHVSLILTADPDVASVSGDRGQLRGAISNLVANAIKCSPAGKKVSIRVVTGEDDVLLQVRDQGKGIAKAELPHIFEKFRQGRKGNGRTGVGLSLALVRSVAEAHGGEVWAESKNRSGSTFSLRLPARQSAAN